MKGTNLHREADKIIFRNANRLRKDQTEAEYQLWVLLRGRNLNKMKFRRQHPYRKYILDFYCHEFKLCVEVDGDIHSAPGQREYDEARTSALEADGICVLRFTNEVKLNGCWKRFFRLQAIVVERSRAQVV